MIPSERHDICGGTHSISAIRVQRETLLRRLHRGLLDDGRPERLHQQTGSDAAAEQPKTEPAPLPAQTSALVPDEDVTAATQPAANRSLSLPVNFAKHTAISTNDETAGDPGPRAHQPIGFFYQNGLPKGLNYEALEEFEKFVNQKFKTGTLRTKVVFIPLRPDSSNLPSPKASGI